MSLEGKRVAVAMSGGLDSSVAAALLVERKAQVIGLTAHMWKNGSRCCSVEDAKRAQRVAWRLGIEHFVLNASESFEDDVVNPFVGEYMRGRTPSPCVVCNQKIKFGFLLTRAVQAGCDLLATGHYAQIDNDNGTYRLLKARDRGKDQSYFLHRLSQKQLSRVLFPLGPLTKEEAVDCAKLKVLPLSGTSESQDVCFVPDGDYGSFVEAKEPAAADLAGEIRSTDGAVLGQHDGIHRFTVGQRRGLGVSSPLPLYVTKLDAKTRTVTAGGRNDAMGNSCLVDDAHWISGMPPKDGSWYDIRIRYNHEGARAKIRILDDRRFEAVFAVAQFAITPGQACVVYDGDQVLGGGWIEGAAIHANQS